MSKTDDSSRAGRREGRIRAAALGAAAVCAAAGFGAIAAAVARRKTARADETVRQAAGADLHGPAHAAAEAIRKAGKWYTYVPAAVAASGVIVAATRDGDRDERSPRAGAAAVLATSVVCTALNPAFDRLLPQPPAPPGHRSRNKPVFPSGHAFGPGAIAFAAAYVLWREEVAPPAVAFPLAVAVPTITAGSRIVAQKHWISDVLGGYLAGIAVAATSLAVYEATRRP